MHTCKSNLPVMPWWFSKFTKTTNMADQEQEDDEDYQNGYDRFDEMHLSDDTTENTSSSESRC